MKKQCPDCRGLGHTYEHKTMYRQTSPCRPMMAESYMSAVNCLTCNGKGRVKYKPSWSKRGNRLR